jgi:hypothetical protein
MNAIMASLNWWCLALDQAEQKRAGLSPPAARYLRCVTEFISALMSVQSCA